MIETKCNYCGNRCGQEFITLKGYVGSSAGILLPDRFQEKHFCDGDCFETWCVVEARVEVRNSNITEEVKAKS